VDRFIHGLHCRPPASEGTIAAFEKSADVQLPDDYRKFLSIVNGAEGCIGKIEFVVLWAIEELVRSNLALNVQVYAPGLLLFGSDGGGEAYGFDMRTSPWTIVQIPFVAMEWCDAWPIATSFTGFLEHLYRAE